MSVKISELPILDSLADNDIVAGVDVSGNVTSKIEMSTLKNYIDTNTQYTAGTNIDITDNVISAPDVYNKNEMDNQIEELQSEVDSLSTIFNAFPTESGEGESLTLDDTAEVKFKKFDLKGNTSQTGTPTPTSPIPVNVVSGDNEINVVGKNLIKVTNGNSSRNNTTLTIQDNVINLKTTGDTTYVAYGIDNTIRNANYGNYVSWGNMTLPAGTYTLSTKYLSGSTTTTGLEGNFIRCVVYGRTVGSTDGVSTELSRTLVTNSSNSNTFTTSQDMEVNIVIYMYANQTPTVNINFQVQLEKSSTATSFEPYQSNTYNIDLPVENLFDKGNANTLNCLVNGTNGSIANYNGAKSLYIPIQSGKTYTISKVLSARFVVGTCVSTPANGVTCNVYSANNTGTSITITSGASDKYLVVFYYLSGTDTLTEQQILDTIQIERGSKANTYTPYGTTPIELCKIGNYQDYFYKDSDKWYLHKEIGKVVLNGSETFGNGWNYQNGCFTLYGISNIIKTTAYADRNQILVMSDYFKAGLSDYRGTISETDYQIAKAIDSNGTQIAITFSNYTSISDFTTWLSSHNLKVYYVLLTPTNTEITYQPLIEQLNLLEKAISYDSQTNISQVNNDLGFIIYAEAIKSLENVLDRLSLLE